MNKGDWVMDTNGRLGQITLREFYPDSSNKGYHLVDFKDKSFARLIHEQYLTPFDPAVSDILNAVNNLEEK